MSTPAPSHSQSQRATATCYCGAVKLEMPVEGSDFVNTHVCHCSDCRKVTATMFASNITVKTPSLTHTRGLDNLTSYSTSATIGTGNTMTSSFCKTCGTLMYRRSSGFPGLSFCRIGTIDDLALHGGKLKPMAEQFVEGRVEWLGSVEGVRQWEGMSTG